MTPSDNSIVKTNTNIQLYGVSLLPVFVHLGPFRLYNITEAFDYIILNLYKIIFYNNSIVFDYPNSITDVVNRANGLPFENYHEF